MVKRRKRRAATRPSSSPCKRGHAGERYVVSGECVECVILRAQQHYGRNSDAIKEGARSRYRSDPETKRAAVRSRALANPEAVRAEKRREYQHHKAAYVARSVAWSRANRERFREMHLAWRKGNPEKLSHWAALHRAARLIRRPPWLTAEQLFEIRGFYAEARRLTTTTGIRHEVDHIVPLLGETVSGLHVPWNLQVLTDVENRAKSNKF
jgi:hypothetical protein